jgi:hypothetical protein
LVPAAERGGSRCEPAVEGPILDRLRHLSGSDSLFAGEIGDGARHLQDPVQRPGRETETLECAFEQAARPLVQEAVAAELRALEAGVDRLRVIGREAAALALARARDPGRDRSAR